MEKGKQLAFSSSFGRHEDDIKTGGLNKREYFAGLAMQGLTSTETFPLDKVAEESVRLADELLKELEK